MRNRPDGATAGRRPLERMQIVGIRYRGARPAETDERGLDAYEASGVYASADVPFEIVEPRMPETERTGDEPRDLGTVNGRIADAVADGRRSGATILMTGGNCTHITGGIGGLQDAHGPGLRLGLVWFDAHGDFNTPRTSTSGSLGGMPVAVAAGLAHPEWRERSHIVAPLSTDRIVLVDVRHLDPAEERLIRATDTTITTMGDTLDEAVSRLSERCEALYLHVDADILDERFVPSHGTKEPGGPDIAQTISALDTVFATGKVVAFALVSIYNRGQEGRVSVASGIELLRGGLTSWAAHGTTV